MPQQPAVPPDAITDAQIKKIAVQLNELGIKDRDKRLALASEVAQRTITSTKDLTKSEASSLIEALTALQEDDSDELDDVFDGDS